MTVVVWARSSSAAGPTATAGSATTATTNCRVLEHSYHMIENVTWPIPQTREHSHLKSPPSASPYVDVAGERRVCELCFSLVPLRAPKYAKEQLRLSRSHTLTQGLLDPHMPLRPNNW